MYHSDIFVKITVSKITKMSQKSNWYSLSSSWCYWHMSSNHMVFMIMNRSVIATNTTRHIFTFLSPTLLQLILPHLKLATFTTRHSASLHWSLTHSVTVWPPDWVIGKLTSAETMSYTSRCHRSRQQRPRHRHIAPDILCDIGLRYGQFATGYQRPFSRWTWVSQCLLKQRMMEVVVTTGAINRAKLQSKHHHQQTNQHPVFYRPDALHVTQPITMSKYWREIYYIPWTC